MRNVKRGWSAADIGDLSGKLAIVTGGNSGIGFHTALELGRKGAHVIIACRDPKRGQEALEKLSAAGPGATFELEALDLASFASVRAFAQRFLARKVPLDLLVNNAGVMAIPRRETTEDGFERQFGTNHLGHFALTGVLLPALRQAKSPRVVSVSSGLAAMGKIDPANLQSERRYAPGGAYSSSKLANLFFMTELGQRAPWLLSVASHPGVARSNLAKEHGTAFTSFMSRLLGQEADAGALPSLYAATGEVKSGEYFGPSKLFHLNGPPVEVAMPKRAHDAAGARKLWEDSERLTGVTYAFDHLQRMSA